MPIMTSLYMSNLDDFTAGNARREHTRICSNISLKESTNPFTGQEREGQYLYKIFYLRQVCPSTNVLLEQIKVQIVLRYWLTKSRQTTKGIAEALKNVMNFKAANHL